ncbi:MAG: hypothetical protein GX023_05475 [Tissierellia bacterium]|nr:hypothetical protein [Tissierellia bacterium]
MSNIIKSTRIIERQLVSREEETDTSIYEALLEEAREKYDEIIKDAMKTSEEIINSAYEKSEEVLNNTHKRAQDIFKESEIKGYEIGHKKGYKEGYDDGYYKGYKEGKEDSKKLISQALDIKKEYIDKRNYLLKDVEKDLIQLVISVYEKVLYEKVEEDEELIVSLILNGIDNLEISQKLTIIVSEEDYEAVKRSKDIILAKASLVDEIDIRINSDMIRGDCVLETSKGNVDVSINNQLKEIKDLLLTIMNNE